MQKASKYGLEPVPTPDAQTLIGYTKILRRTKSAAPCGPVIGSRRKMHVGGLDHLPVSIDLCLAAQIGVQRLWQHNRSVGLLTILDDGNQCTPNREARTV